MCVCECVSERVLTPLLYVTANIRSSLCVVQCFVSFMLKSYRQAHPEIEVDQLSIQELPYLCK